mmetsp:Transcript_34962/g.84569  ORF Transcript_34962/g.84569 Transcript_34962/m.84569 type:complete len:199 (+) Transcript_34962:2108-2704(+)
MNSSLGKRVPKNAVGARAFAFGSVESGYYWHTTLSLAVVAIVSPVLSVLWMPPTWWRTTRIQLLSDMIVLVVSHCHHVRNSGSNWFDEEMPEIPDKTGAFRVAEIARMKKKSVISIVNVLNYLVNESPILCEERNRKCLVCIHNELHLVRTLCLPCPKTMNSAPLKGAAIANLIVDFHTWSEAGKYYPMYVSRVNEML